MALNSIPNFFLHVFPTFFCENSHFFVGIESLPGVHGRGIRLLRYSWEGVPTAHNMEFQMIMMTKMAKMAKMAKMVKQGDQNDRDDQDDQDDQGQ